MFNSINQQKLASSTIMVVGCGALGNEVLKNLVLMGVGHLVLVDFDTVEVGNLTRSVLYRRQDVGLPKVQVAKAALLEMNPELQVETIQGDISYDVGLGTLLRMDVIMGCVDSRWARYNIQRLCLRVGKTWVDGGILGLEGTARVFRPGCNCYACNLGQEGMTELQHRMPCAGIIRRQEQAGHAPTTSIIASIIGAVMVQEAIRVITNGPAQTRMFYYDGDTLATRTPVFQAWDEDCALHDQWDLQGMGHDFSLSLSSTIQDVLPHGTLVLNEPFVDYLIDRKTDERITVMLPAHQVESYITQHPQWNCRLLSDFYQHEIREIGEGFPYPWLKLNQLGIPPEDIIRFRLSDSSYRYYKI